MKSMTTIFLRTVQNAMKIWDVFEFFSFLFITARRVSRSRNTWFIEQLALEDNHVNDDVFIHKAILCKEEYIYWISKECHKIFKNEKNIWPSENILYFMKYLEFKCNYKTNFNSCERELSALYVVCSVLVISIHFK